MKSYLLSGFLAFIKFFAKFKKALPAGLAGLFIIIQFFIDLFKDGTAYAFKHLAEQLFAAEYTINKAVTAAIQNDSSYNFFAFISILSSVIILIFFIKFVGGLLVKIAGAQAIWGAYLFAIIILIILEISVIKIIDGVWGFVPIKDGIWFLLMNLQPVFSNIF